MNNVAPGYLTPYVLIGSIAVVAAVLFGLRGALRLAGLPGRNRRYALWSVSALLLAWFFGALILSWLTDLVVAVTTGFLTSPSPLQMLAFDRPNQLISSFPMVMIPVFLVPLAVLLHLASLEKLRQTENGPRARYSVFAREEG